MTGSRSNGAGAKCVKNENFQPGHQLVGEARAHSPVDVGSHIIESLLAESGRCREDLWRDGEQG